MSDEAREAVRLWRDKAQSDWTTVEILRDSGRGPADVVCFHCQQFVEKLLKGLLTRHGAEAPRTHDLRRLVELAEGFVPALGEMTDAADVLTVHGVETRYPDTGHGIDRAEMDRVIASAREFGDILLGELDV